MSLYQKYRPQNLNQIQGQKHISTILHNAIKHHSIGHAYLFSGPRGTGKTSIARILAMALNCENSQTPKTEQVPCGQCQTCQSIRSGANLNVIEIDAASNRGIDEIRNLREMVKLHPPQGVNKVFIIDEVHMLTKEAFNALLKTLEEPPPQTHFILATTELHRVPDTVISRTQHLEFHRAQNSDLIKQLTIVAKKEKFKIDQESLALIAQHADGSFRDALSILEQVSVLGAQIDRNLIYKILGIAPEEELAQLLQSYFNHDYQTMNQVINNLSEKGYDIAATIDALIKIVRDLIWKQLNLKKIRIPMGLKEIQKPVPELVKLIERLILAKTQLRWTPVPQLPLELALLDGAKQLSTKKKTENLPKKHFPNSETVIPVTPNNATNADTNNSNQHLTPKLWHNLLEHIKQHNASLAALLRASFYQAADRILIIQVPFAFYAECIKEKKNLKIIHDALIQIMNDKWQVECEVKPTIATTSSKPESQFEDTIREVFGEYLVS